MNLSTPSRGRLAREGASVAAVFPALAGAFLLDAARCRPACAAWNAADAQSALAPRFSRTVSPATAKSLTAAVSAGPESAT